MPVDLVVEEAPLAQGGQIPDAIGSATVDDAVDDHTTMQVRMRALANVGPLDIGQAHRHHQVIGDAEGGADCGTADRADAVHVLMLACGSGQREVVEIVEADELVDHEGRNLPLAKRGCWNGVDRPSLAGIARPTRMVGHRWSGE